MLREQIGHTIIKSTESNEKIKHIISIKNKNIAILSIKKNFINGYNSIDYIYILKSYRYRGYIRTLVEYHILNKDSLLIDLSKEEKDKEIWYNIAETPGWLLYRSAIDINNVEVKIPTIWGNIDRDFFNKNTNLYLKLYKREVSKKTLEYNEKINKAFNIGDWLKIRKRYNP